MSYASPAEFKSWAGIDDVESDTEIQMVLDAATRSIDRVTGRHFTLEEGVTKYYVANYADHLNVSDLIAADSISIDVNGTRTYSETLSAANYELLPYLDETGATSVRFQEIRVWPTSSSLFSPGYTVRIVGDFGYVDEDGNTPADIKQACLILASRLWKRRETPFGVLSIPDLGTTAQIRKTDPDVANLLEPYTRSQAWVMV